MGDPKRILIIEDDEDYRKLLEAVIRGSGKRFEILTCANFGDGLVSAKHSAPDLILVDLDLPDSTGYTTFLRLREQVPEAPLVILTAFDDDETAVRAVEDGALDYLVKTVMRPNLILRHLHMALTRQGQRDGARVNTGIVLAFIGSKGGVGTSTTALNAAAMLSLFGCETVLLEFPLGPGTSPMFVERPPASTLTDLLGQLPPAIHREALRECLVETAPGLHLAYPGSPTQMSASPDADQMQSLISAAHQFCPTVVLDLPPRLEEYVVTALNRADSVVLVVDREPASVHCAAAVMEQIRTVISSGAELGSVIVDRTGTDHSQSFRDLKTQLKGYLLALLPHADDEVRLSYTARTPFVLLSRNTQSYQGYQELMERLIGSAVRAGISNAGYERLLNRKMQATPMTENAYG